MLRRIWHRITRTNRVRALETEIARRAADIARLRTENRALLNSILGVAGIPPIAADYSTERALAAAAHATEMFPATLVTDAAANSAVATSDASPRAPSLFTQSHSESSTRPLADDESLFRSPPPANGHNLSLGAPLAQPQRARPRNDSLPPVADHVAQVFRPEGVSNGGDANASVPASQKLRTLVPPHRRRSWHQITRVLEIESTRKQ